MKTLLTITLVTLITNSASAGVIKSVANELAELMAISTTETVVKKEIRPVPGGVGIIKSPHEEIKLIAQKYKPAKGTTILFPLGNEVASFDSLTNHLAKNLKAQASVKRTKLTVGDAQWSGPKAVKINGESFDLRYYFSEAHFEYSKDQGNDAIKTILANTLLLGMFQSNKIAEKKFSDLKAHVSSIERLLRTFKGTAKDYSDLIAKVNVLKEKHDAVFPGIKKPFTKDEIDEVINSNENITRAIIENIERYYDVTPKDGSRASEFLTQFINSHYPIAFEQGRRKILRDPGLKDMDYIPAALVSELQRNPSTISDFAMMALKHYIEMYGYLFR